MQNAILCLVLMLINVAAFVTVLHQDKQLQFRFSKKDAAAVIILLIGTYLCCIKRADYSAIYIAAAMAYLALSAVLDHHTGLVYMWGMWELAALFHILYFMKFGQICFTACMAGAGYYLLYRLKAYGKGDVALLTALSQMALFIEHDWLLQLMHICLVMILSFGIFLLINLFSGNIQRDFSLKRKMPMGPSILLAGVVYLFAEVCFLI